MLGAVVRDGQTHQAQRVLHDGSAFVAMRRYPVGSWDNRSQPFVGPNGASLAITPTFVDDLRIYDGGDTTLWTPTTLSGSFDATATPPSPSPQGGDVIDAAASGDGDTLALDGGSYTIAAGTSLRGYIYITNWRDEDKNVRLQLREGAITHGSVLLGDWINRTTHNTWMQFSIPTSAFGTEGEDIDRVTIETVSAGQGPAPDYYIDDLRLASGEPQDFLTEPRRGRCLHVTNIRWTAIHPSTTFDPSGFLGGPALESGVVYQRWDEDGILASGSFQTTFDLMAVGLAEIERHVGPSSQMVTLTSSFAHPLILEPNGYDRLVFRVAEDLSGFTELRVSVSGYEEALAEIPGIAGDVFERAVQR